MRRTLVALIAGLALLAGCQADPEPIEPDPTESPSVLAPPKMPPEASEASEEGAAAFVRHWIDVFNHAAATGDTGELRSLSKPCESCNGYADDFEALDDSERPEGSAWSLRDLIVESATSDPLKIRTRVDVEEVDRSVEYRLVFYLQMRAKSYTVIDIRQESE